MSNNSRSFRHGPWSLAVVLALIGGHSLPAEPAMPEANDAPIVIELFTSQGCSSCPPADRLLSRLGEEDAARVIPLSFHVDYWNYIGWTDPFSSAEWSERQSRYAKAFRSSRVYTPQLVVNGRTDCVGSDEKEVRAQIARATREGPAGELTLKLQPDSQALRLRSEVSATVRKSDPGKSWSVMVAVFEDRLVTPVPRGENTGRTLKNSHVVRSLTEAFSLPAKAGARHAESIEIEIGADWDLDNLGVAVFLQDPDSLHIHGAVVEHLS